MIPMPQLTAEDELTHLAKRFAHWRQHRPSPKARIPKELWDEAVSLILISNFSVSRVAKELGLGTADLKKRCPASATSQPVGNGDAPIRFVDVTPPSPWRSPVVEVDLKRADGAHLHLAYHDGAPQLTDVVRAFLESI